MKHGDDIADGDTFTSPSKPITEMTLRRGAIIAGRFTIEGLAGRGGMGFVYRAIDSRTGQQVALKLMQAITSPEAAHRFKREAFVLSELRHPAIVSYIDQGVIEEGQPFLAMEWLEGVDLARRLLRQPLGLSESMALLRRITEALATAHRQGIVHRDIKPSNLFLRGGRPEDVVLLDFGLARHAVPSLVALTGTDAVLGTPGYMAPEQASSQPHITPSADIFSLGCVLYECLTGQPPSPRPTSPPCWPRSSWPSRPVFTRCAPACLRACRCSWTACWTRIRCGGRRMPPRFWSRSRPWTPHPRCCRCPPLLGATARPGRGRATARRRGTAAREHPAGVAPLPGDGHAGGG
ncbi:serine/threonine-protein kinase [Cystobacter fuscus]